MSSLIPHSLSQARRFAVMAEVEEGESTFVVPYREQPDTLGAWLHWRFGMARSDWTPWNQLDEVDQSYWEHEADAVRRAVERGGFK